METDETLLIKQLLSRKPEGISITEIVSLSGLTRSAVRTILAQLEGANQVSVRNIGMAKLYSFKKEVKDSNENSYSADSIL